MSHDEIRQKLADVLQEHAQLYGSECSCDGVLRPDDIQALHQVDALLPRIREHVAKAVQAERERIGARLAAVPDEYYPQDVFGGPFSTDESRMANEALREHGLTIDRISANVMRHAYRVAASIAVQEPGDA